MLNLRFILGIISLVLSSHVASSPIHRPWRAELFNRGLYSTHTQNSAVMTLTVTPTVAGSTVPVTICVDLRKAGSTGTASIVPCPMLTYSSRAADTTTSAPATSSTSTLKNGEVPAIGVGTGNPPVSYLYSSSWYYFPTMALTTSSHSPSNSGPSFAIPPSTTQPTTSTTSPSSTGTSPISTVAPSDITTTSSLPIKVTSLPVSSSTLVQGTTSLLSKSTSDSQQSRPTTVFNTTKKTVYLPPTSTKLTSSYTTVPNTTSATYPGWNSTLPSFSTITQSITSTMITSGFSSTSFTPSATTSLPSLTSTIQLTTKSSATTALSTSSPLVTFTTEPATESPTMTYPSFSNTLPSFTTVSSELSTSQIVTSTYAPAPSPTEAPTTSSNPLVVIPVTDEIPAPSGIEIIPIEP
ncbi:hypothetical protein H112_08336 [Trichophyton rubrum D6]|nr:hypothetical protein H112_08336 [Trichophyton rubrum D6]